MVATAFGYRLSLLGRFDYTSESALARSPVTGIEVERFSGEPIMSVSDFRVPVGDLQDLPQLLRGNDIITGGSGFGTNELYGFAGDDRSTGGPTPTSWTAGPGSTNFEVARATTPTLAIVPTTRSRIRTAARPSSAASSTPCPNRSRRSRSPRAARPPR